MKNLIRVALVAVGLFLAGNSAQAQQKFAHINSSDLLQAMPEMKTADASFKTFADAKQKELEAMESERQKKITGYNEKAKTISEANKDVVSKEMETMAKEIQDIETRITAAQQKAQEDVTKKREELYQPVITKAEAAVKTVAKEKGFAYVFDISQPGVVYFDGGEDMLPAVKLKLGIK